ncbi:MAG: cyclic nucleotide-binding domain-containing protein [Oscillibacter sp.]|nr:cyclic nucleotide-binding domain-containing protein [Oscillibacter sp.]
MQQTTAGRAQYPEGAVIFLEGTVSTCMYFIHYGKVGIYAHYGTKDQKLLTTLEAGRFFGEMGMVRGFPRSATAVSMAYGTDVATVTWDTLTEYFHTEPVKVVLLMQQMAARIGELSDDYIGACGEITRMVHEQAQMEQELEHLRAARAGTSPAQNSAAKKGQSEKNARLKKYMDSYRAHAAVDLRVTNAIG